MDVSPKVCSTTGNSINITVNSETLERYCELHKKFFKNLRHIAQTKAIKVCCDNFGLVQNRVISSETAPQI